MANFTYFCAGTVYDYYYLTGEGMWNNWTESISNEESKIADGASVSVFCSNNDAEIFALF